MPLGGKWSVKNNLEMASSKYKNKKACGFH